MAFIIRLLCVLNIAWQAVTANDSCIMCCMLKLQGRTTAGHDLQHSTE